MHGGNISTQVDCQIYPENYYWPNQFDNTSVYGTTDYPFQYYCPTFSSDLIAPFKLIAPLPLRNIIGPLYSMLIISLRDPVR